MLDTIKTENLTGLQANYVSCGKSELNDISAIENISLENKQYHHMVQ